MLNRQPPTSNAYSDDRNEEIRYLKWDLLRFLEPGDVKLLTLKTKKDIARLAACLSAYRNVPDTQIDFRLALDLLFSTRDQIEQTLNAFNRMNMSGAHTPTPREKLVQAELVQVLDRMGHMGLLSENGLANLSTTSHTV